MRAMITCVLCLGALTAVSSLAATRSGRIDADEHWSASENPWVITADVTIPEGVSVTAEPGVRLQLASGRSIFVYGRLDLRGEVDSPIHVEPQNTSRWGAINYEDQGAGDVIHCFVSRGDDSGGDRIGMINVYQSTGAVLIESCTFEDWPDDFNRKAIHMRDAPNVVIRDCWFGEGENEAVHGFNAPAVVEYCTFMHRYGYSDAVDIGETSLPGPVPHISHNTFYGGDDDAIDLDTCDAIVDGNLIMHHRGGSHDPIGVSGDQDTHPIIINNVIIDCESGVGFKNGADITVVNNTIIDCDKGIWMHQNPAHCRAVNNIIWVRDDQLPIKLEPGSTIDISHSIISGESVYPGEGNSNADPLFVDKDALDFHLQPDSPAIGAGVMDESAPDHDFDLTPRDSTIDIGAYAFQPPSAVHAWWMLR
ncbi:MAG: hypothetical protein GC154_02800 [bacterium]|nr:hypothetical protein [bacterium]